VTRFYRYWVPFGITVTFIAGGLIFPITNIGPEGDPGGRILAQLTNVASAVPPNAHVNYTNGDEPHSDSCDGNPNTVGWDPAVVQINFSWRSSSKTLWQKVGGALHRLGWRWAPGSVETTTFRWVSIGSWNWKTWLKPKRLAIASLSKLGFSNIWDLVVEAPATLAPPTGC
jgi:hypothetical protein